MPTERKPQSHSDYCADQVRLYDYYRYFSATCAPEPVRRGLMALYAFNLEIAATRERVSEALIGQMRLQWWRDTLDGIYDGNVRDHAVAAEIAYAIDVFNLSRGVFERIIDGRLFDLEDEPPEDTGALMNYVSATSGALTCLAAKICGLNDWDDQADSAGCIWGLTGLLRAFPHHAVQRRVYIPKDMLRAAGVTADDLIEQKPDVNAAAAFEALAGVALEAAAAAAGMRCPKAVRPAVAHVSIRGSYLSRLKRAGYDVYADGLEPTRFGAQTRILRSMASGKI
jgi:NADH dehydrogenase [ubiquinone] 1 alpha subcomplex assembly factor 6